MIRNLVKHERAERSRARALNENMIAASHCFNLEHVYPSTLSPGKKSVARQCQLRFPFSGVAIGNIPETSRYAPLLHTRLHATSRCGRIPPSSSSSPHPVSILKRLTVIRSTDWIDIRMITIGMHSMPSNFYSCRPSSTRQGPIHIRSTLRRSTIRNTELTCLRTWVK